MNLTSKEQALLDGKQGETMKKITRTLVRYGELFGAEKLVPITSDYHHFVTSFGLKALTPIYDLFDELIHSKALAQGAFTVDPRPLDPQVPSSLIKDLVFKKFMYSKQEDYEEQLRSLGLLHEDGFTCTPYMEEVGNIPKEGDVLSWSESSAVVYANSVLGARCNRNSGVIDLLGAVAGFVPYFGLLTDEGRKATWLIDVKTSKAPEAQLLGSAIGMKVIEEVPYIRGLDQWIGQELDEKAKAYLKNFGAATASNGAVGLFHVEHLTPEAKAQGEALLQKGFKRYVIDDEELERIYKSYPIMWKKEKAKPKLCFIGCPHLSQEELIWWSDEIHAKLQEKGLKKVTVPTVLTAAPQVLEHFKKRPQREQLEKAGVILSAICPLMYMNNPLCANMNVMTSSNKLRTYTTARYYTDAEILTNITGGSHERV